MMTRSVVHLLRLVSVALATVAALGAMPGTSIAAVAHTVEKGETLWSIAYANGFHTDALAAYNGLPADAALLAGSTIMIPSVAEARAAAASSAAASYSSEGEIAQIAAEYGFLPGLPTAIAYFESGFNQGVVSPSGARGVMQLLPGTFRWIRDDLAGMPLDPRSRVDNIRAGMTYLDYLWDQTGGDVEATAAAYYQGLRSMRRDGVFPETERYVADVMALRDRFQAP
jgi:soluble lytic murein transglycosylase-like protein